MTYLECFINVTNLEHELWDDSVEGAALVVKSFAR